MRTKEQILRALLECSQSDDDALRSVAQQLIVDPSVPHELLSEELFEDALASDGRW